MKPRAVKTIGSLTFFDKAFRPDREEYPPTPKGEKAYKAALEKSLEAQEKAQKICDRCPFKTQCMSESLSRPMPPHRRKSDDLRLDYDRYGVFGGTTPEYREELFDHLAQSLGYTKQTPCRGLGMSRPRHGRKSCGAAGNAHDKPRHLGGGR